MTFEPRPLHHDGKRSLTESVSYRLTSFIRSFTTILYVGMGLAVVGVVMKFLGLTGGSFVFVFSMAFLMLLFLVQVGLSFFYIVSNVRLALLGSISSLSLVTGFLALIFRYQNWYGWQFVFYFALPVYLIVGVLLFLYLKRYKKLHEPLRDFFYRNLVIPFGFLLVLGIVSFLFRADEFNKEEDGMLQESPIPATGAAAEQDTTGMWRSY
jgi:MFS family permease